MPFIKLAMFDSIPPKTSESDSWDQEYLAGRDSWDVGLPDPHISNLIKTGLITSGTLLDVGCGAGNETIYLAQQGFEATGIDISPVAIDLAYSRAAKGGVRCRFIVADVLCLPFQNEKFEVVLDKACFHFILPHDRQTYIESIKSVIKPNGKFILFAASEYDTTIDGPYKFTREEILNTFKVAFKILFVEPVILEHHRLKPRPYFCLMENHSKG